MPLPKRPRDPIARANLVMDKVTGEVPNDNERVLAAREQEAAPEPEPTGHAKA